MLPRLDGYQVFERAFGTPTIFLTAKSELTDKLKGLAMGADDYLTKPFQMLELAARVEAVSRIAESLSFKITIEIIKIIELKNTIKIYGSFPAPWQDYGLMYIGNLSDTIQSWRHTKNILFLTKGLKLCATLEISSFP